MKALGLFLLMIGGWVAAGYGLYYFFKVFLSTLSIPGALKVALALAVVGVLLVLASLARDRFRRGRRGRFKELDWWP